MHQKVLRILKISAQAMKISNFEEEEIKVLSREEHKSFENICYICQENVKDKYDKDKKRRQVRDRCYYTGKYQGAVHSICNSKFSVTKETLIVF